MFILLYILAAVGVTIAKGWKTHKQLCDHSYSWKEFAVVALAWATMTLPFIGSACDEFTCKWSLNFGWWAKPIQQVPFFDKLDPVTTVTVVMLAYLVLTIYFFGHCFGWAIYGSRKLLRLAA